jgi:hypothetical protein
MARLSTIDYIGVNAGAVHAFFAVKLAQIYLQSSQFSLLHNFPVFFSLSLDLFASPQLLVNLIPHKQSPLLGGSSLARGWILGSPKLVEKNPTNAFN